MADERYAIDPLEHFYATRPTLVALRRPGVTYLDGTGERLPFDDATFSLVIIDNVIDHTYAPERILREIQRILQPDGHLYLSVNVHTRWGALLHTVLAGAADRPRASAHVHQPDAAPAAGARVSSTSCSSRSKTTSGRSRPTAVRRC